MAVDVISNVIKYLIVEGFLILEYLIIKFKFDYLKFKLHYADHEKSDKHQQISKPGSWSDFKVKQNAVEMHNLLNIFPISFGRKVPEDLVHWKVLLSFLHVVELLSSSSFKCGEVMYLRDCIEEFLELYKAIVPDSKLKPKAHFDSLSKSDFRTTCKP